MKIETPDDMIPIIKKFNIQDALELFKLLRGYILIDVLQPPRAPELLYFIATKPKGDGKIYRIIRFKSNISYPEIIGEFEPASIDDAVVQSFTILTSIYAF